MTASFSRTLLTTTCHAFIANYFLEFELAEIYNVILMQTTYNYCLRPSELLNLQVIVDLTIQYTVHTHEGSDTQLNFVHQKFTNLWVNLSKSYLCPKIRMPQNSYAP